MKLFTRTSSEVKVSETACPLTFRQANIVIVIEDIHSNSRSRLCYYKNLPFTRAQGCQLVYKVRTKPTLC